MLFKALRLLILIYGLMITVNGFSETIYKWQNKNNVTVYSNQPKPGAQKIELDSLTISNAPPEASNNQDQKQKSKIKKDKKRNAQNAKELKKRFDLKILSPQSNDSIANSKPHMKIKVQNLQALLKRDYQLTIYIDGRNTALVNIQNNQIKIPTPPPGQHSLRIKAQKPNMPTLRTLNRYFYIQPKTRKSQAGTQKITNQSYQDETSGKNLKQFKKSHQDQLIQKQKPYSVTNQDYRQQFQND
jgi:hypothetical protein